MRVRIDGAMYEIDDTPTLNRKQKHTIEVVVDRLIVRADMQKRLTDSLETAMGLSGGLVVVSVVDGEEMLFSQNYACPDCGISIEELTPRMFSFNNPYGACPTCTGLGVLTKVDPAAVIPDPSLSLNEGAISVSGWNSADDGGTMAHMYLEGLAEKYGFSLDTPVRDLPESALDKVLYGTRNEKLTLTYRRENGASHTYTAPFEGIIPNLERRYRETNSESAKEVLEGYMANVACPDCKGKRLKREALAVTFGGLSIAEVSDMSVRDSLAFFQNVELSEKARMIANQILKEINSRLGFLVNVGLDYLTLSRAAATAVRRRSAAHSLGHANWFQPGGRIVYFG